MAEQESTLVLTIRELKRARMEVEVILGLRAFYNPEESAGVTTYLPGASSDQALKDTEALKTSAKALEDTYSTSYPELFADLSSEYWADMGCLGAVSFVSDVDFGSKLKKLYVRLDDRIRALSRTLNEGSYLNAGQTSTWQKVKSAYGSPYNSRYTDTDSTEASAVTDYLAQQEAKRMYVTTKCTAIASGTPITNSEGEMPSLTEALKASVNPLKPPTTLFNYSATQSLVTALYPGGTLFCNPKMNITSYGPSDYTTAKASLPTPDAASPLPQVTGSLFMKSGAYQDFSRSMNVSLARMDFYIASGTAPARSKFLELSAWRSKVLSLLEALHKATDDASVMKAFSALQAAKEKIDAQALPDA